MKDDPFAEHDNPQTRQPRLMIKVADACKHHGHIRGVRRRNHLAISNRTARLNDSTDISFCKQLNTIFKRKEAVRGGNCTVAAFFSLLNRQSHRSYTARLSLADPNRAALSRKNYCIRFYVFSRFPSKCKVVILRLCRGAFRCNPPTLRLGFSDIWT